MTSARTAARAARKEPRKPRHRWLALSLGLLLAVVAAEAFLRWMGVVHEIGPSFTEWHAEDGLQVKKNLRVTRSTPEFTMRFTSNSDGYRGAELPATITQSILCLGDSFTMGYGVDDGLEFPALLAREVPPGWTVVNAGIGGTGNGRWIHVLPRVRERLKPRIVVLQICGNDRDDNLAEQLFRLDADGTLAPHPPLAWSFRRRMQTALDAVPLLSYSHLVSLGRQIGPHAASTLVSPPAVETAPGTPLPGQSLTHALVRRAVLECRAIGAVPLAIGCALPSAEERALADLLRELQVRFVATPSKEERPELYFKVDPHWNGAGHAVVAELIWRELQRPEYGLARAEAR